MKLKSDLVIKSLFNCFNYLMSKTKNNMNKNPKVVFLILKIVGDM